MSEMKKAEELSYQMMAKFRKSESNEHLYPWVAYREGVVAGYFAAQDKARAEIGALQTKPNDDKERDEIIENAMCDSSESERFGEASHAHERGFMSGFRYCEKMLSNETLQNKIKALELQLFKAEHCLGYYCEHPFAKDWHKHAVEYFKDIAKLKETK